MKRIKEIIKEYRFIAAMLLSFTIIYASALKINKVDVYNLKDQILVVSNEVRKGTAIMINDRIAITANHLLDYNATISFGEHELKYKVLRRDKIRNIAVLEIDTKDYSFKKLKISKRNIKQDKDVLVIGNSYDRGRFISRGKVNSIVLESTVYGYIDAATTKEGEGSAVFDKDGRLIGIVIHNIDRVSIVLPLRELILLFGDYENYLK